MKKNYNNYYTDDDQISKTPEYSDQEDFINSILEDNQEEKEKEKALLTYDNDFNEDDFLNEIMQNKEEEEKLEKLQREEKEKKRKRKS